MFQSTWEKLFHRKRMVKHDRKIKFTTQISKLEAGGKPSTKFPPERLVDGLPPASSLEILVVNLIFRSCLTIRFR